MKNKRLNLCSLLLFGFCLNLLYAQQAIPTSGGYASGNGSSVSYSVGQIVYTTNVGANGTISQGVQQPYEISITTGTDKKDINLFYSVYPNPTIDYLTLKVADLEPLNYAYKLFDRTGRIFKSEKITTVTTSISMDGLMPNTYILKISVKNKEVKSFKIIKN
ncbi:MAG: T9SS type A sorting domain-containing protein [Paludibacter sp.]